MVARKTIYTIRNIGNAPSTFEFVLILVPLPGDVLVYGYSYTSLYYVVPALHDICGYAWNGLANDESSLEAT